MTNIFVTFYLNICPELVCVAAKTKKEYAEKMKMNGLKKDFCKQSVYCEKKYSKCISFLHESHILR